MAFLPPTRPPDAVHPIPMRGLSCGCGAELEVDNPDQPTRILCPAGCLVERTEPIRSGAAPLCDRCHRPIVRAAGYSGRTPKFHEACRTSSELASLEAKRRRNEQVRMAKVPR